MCLQSTLLSKAAEETGHALKHVYERKWGRLGMIVCKGWSSSLSLWRLLMVGTSRPFKWFEGLPSSFPDTLGAWSQRWPAISLRGSAFYWWRGMQPFFWADLLTSHPKNLMEWWTLYLLFTICVGIFPNFIFIIATFSNKYFIHYKSEWYWRRLSFVLKSISCYTRHEASTYIYPEVWQQTNSVVILPIQFIPHLRLCSLNYTGRYSYKEW